MKFVFFVDKHTKLFLLNAYLCICRVANNRPISIYNDENSGSRRQPENVKANVSGWHTLAIRADRNKENTSVPTIWSSYKVWLVLMIVHMTFLFIVTTPNVI